MSVNRLPRRAREWAYSLGGMTEAVRPREVPRLDLEAIAGGLWLMTAEDRCSGAVVSPSWFPAPASAPREA